MTKIKNIMSKNVEVIGPDADLTEVAEKMKLEQTGVLPVCDGNKIRGMITDRDIVIRAIAEEKDPHSVRASDIMSRGVHYLFEDDTVDEAISLMRSKNVRRIVVLDENKKLCGILSVADLGWPMSEESLGSKGSYAGWGALLFSGILAGLGYYFYQQGSLEDVKGYISKLSSKLPGRAA